MSIYKPRKRKHLRLVYDADKVNRDDVLPNVPSQSSSNEKLVKPKNSDRRSREYLRPSEVKRLIAAVKTVGRNKLRDELLLEMMYRHGLRVSEAVHLRWSDVDFETARIHVRRIKNGNDSVQPIYPDELKLLKKYKKATKHQTPWIFMSERGTVMSDDVVRTIVLRAGEIAGFDFPLHPHMLRHSCGYALAEKGTDTRRIQDYLGHKCITHTVRYTQLAPNRFDGLWD